MSLVAGFFAIAVCARPGVGVGFAQSASTESGSKASAASAPAAGPDQAAKQAVAGQPQGDGQPASVQPVNPQQAEIMDESANLLKLANSLKAEVDKTTQDTLSIAVIRQADEIEKLAHKMRAR